LNSTVLKTDEVIPKVSVIIPTHNRAHLIGRAIQSVLDQTYQDFELIVVDDGSTDNTEKVVNSYDDRRIRYIKHDENEGGAAARNTGIKAARGEYIAFQDSDDEWLPEKLEKQMKVFETVSPKVGIVYTDMKNKSKGGKVMHSPKIMPEDGIIYEQALDFRVMGIGIQTAVIRRECFGKAEMFDEKIPRSIDQEFFIRLSKYYYFYHIDEPLVNYFVSPVSITSDNKALVVAKKLILEKYFEDISKDEKLLAKHYFVIGKALYLQGEVESGRKYILQGERIEKDRKLLAQHYSNIGLDLCSKGKFTHGRRYLVKAFRARPLNAKFVLALIASLLGQRGYNVSIDGYMKARDRLLRRE